MKRKKEIYFVIPSMCGGGAEKDAYMLLKYIDRKKFNIKLIVFNKTGTYLSSIPSDIEIIDLNKKSKWSIFKLIFKLRSIVKKQKPDILFSFINYANVITVLATLFLKHRFKIILNESNYPKGYLPDFP